MEQRRVRVAPGVELRTLTWSPAGPRRAPDFLLVHGLASNALLWCGVAERLVAAGHRTVALDQRGHGRSGGSGEGVADLATLVDDLRTVADASGLDRPVVVGQSWGGNLVLELGRRAPETVTGVVGVDGGVIDLAARFPDWESCREALTPPPITGTDAGELEARMRERLAGWPEAGIAGQLANFRVRDDGTVAPHLALEDHLAILRTLWEHRPADYLPEVRVPVLLLPVVGSDDPEAAARREAVEHASRLLPDVRVREFVDRSHDVHAEAPDEVAEELLRTARAWLERERGGAA